MQNRYMHIQTEIPQALAPMQIQFPSGLCIPTQPHTYVQFNKQFCFKRMSFIRYRSIFLTINTEYRLEIVSKHYFNWLMYSHCIILFHTDENSKFMFIAWLSGHFFMTMSEKKNMIRCCSVFSLVLD